MTTRLFQNDQLFLQRFTKVAGLYEGPLDGRSNPALREAEQRLAAENLRLRTACGAADPRSESSIATLLPKAQEKARQFLAAAARRHVSCRILSGTRTYAAQNALYAQGRATAGPIVTNARGGQSFHNFGIAWDVGIFVDGAYVTGRTPAETRRYTDLAHAMLADVDGLDWGGNWVSFPDMPHYQLAMRDQTVSTVREKFERGEEFT